MKKTSFGIAILWEMVQAEPAIHCVCFPRVDLLQHHQQQVDDRDAFYCCNQQKWSSGRPHHEPAAA